MDFAQPEFHVPPEFPSSERQERFASAYPEIDQLFGDFATEYRIPGVAFGVITDNALSHSSGVGTANVATGLVPSSDTVFRIASMTKSVTAISILMLRDDGLLSLEDPVAKYVPELQSLRYPTKDSAPITIKALLSMSSGFVEDDPWGDRLLGMDSATFTDLIASELAFDLVPCTAYEYSNLGYAILGRVVENVSGTPLRELSRTRLFEPLGMTSTTWDADRVPAEVAAIGYRLQNGEWVPEPSLPDGAFGAMGGLATSVEDLARYVSFHLSAHPPRDDDDKGPLRRSSLREMAQPHQAGPTYLSPADRHEYRLLYEGYGYGLVAAVHSRYGRVVAHSGGLPGFASHMEWLPDHGVAVVALANRTYRPVKDVVRKAIDALESTGALVPRKLSPSPALMKTREAIKELYENWNEEFAASTMLDTYFMDQDDDRRPPNFAELRTQYGACLSLDEISPTGALRGQWRMTCERGALDVSVILGPQSPSRIQFIRVSPTKPDPNSLPS